MSDNVHSIFEPNPSVIRSHLERLFRRVRTEYPEGWCEIIWSDERGKPTQAKWFSVTAMGLDAATECVVVHNKERRNVYVGVNPRRPQTAPFGRASAEDVEISFFQFVDADSAEAAGRVRRAPLPYSWIVLTGKVPNPRPHAYWELDEPIRNMDAWRNQQRAMAAYFGSDPVIDPPRIMRLAGTINFPSEKKREDGYRIEVVTLRTLYDDEERDPVSSEALFHAYPWIAESAYQRQGFDPETGEFDEKPERPDFDAYRPVDPLVYVRNIEQGRELHNNARDLIAHLISTGQRDWLVRDYLTKLLTPVSDGGTLGQIDEMIRSWRAKTDIPDPPEDYEDFDAPPPPGPDPQGYTVQAWLDRDLPEPDMLLGPFSTTSRGLFVADTGLGKTNFAMAISFAMAAGSSFLHWKCHRPAKVLFIDGEMSRRLLRSRIRDASRRLGAVLDNLYFLCHDDFEDMPPLNTLSGQKFIEDFMQQIGGVDFISFDNVQALLLGDMKDEEPWQQTLPWIRDLTRRSVGQMWVHHTGHDASRSYGTKTREWQLDSVMVAEAACCSEADIAFSLKFTKARERGPDNRRDFAGVNINLASDQWSFEWSEVQPEIKNVSPQAVKFLNALFNAMSNPGAVIHPAPGGRRAISLDAWKRECLNLGLLDDEKPDSERALFSKNRRALIEGNLIVVMGDLVWAI